MTTTLLITLTALLSSLTLLCLSRREARPAYLPRPPSSLASAAQSRRSPPRPIHWTAPESGYHAESPLPKESQ